MFRVYLNARVNIPEMFHPFLELVDWGDTGQAWEIPDVEKMEFDSFRNQFDIFFMLNDDIVEMHVRLLQPNDILMVVSN